VQRPPQRLALAPAAGDLRIDVGGGDHLGACLGGHPPGVVGGVVVDDDDLVHQAQPVDEVAAQPVHHPPDRRGLVVGRDAHGDDLVTLGVDQVAQRDVAVVPRGDRRDGSRRRLNRWKRSTSCHQSFRQGGAASAP
jgi:hypothetical protein